MVRTMVGETPKSPSSSSLSPSAWLENYRVGSLPSIYYVPEFVSPSEEALLFHEVQVVPVAKWKTLKHRRLQNWGGVVHEKGLISQSIPAWLRTITEKITKETDLFPAPINHVLVNEYLPGQGITAHQDGPLYHPVVAIVSLGAPTLMHFTPHTRLTETTKYEIEEKLEEVGQPREDETVEMVEATCSVALMPGSLLVFKDLAYSDYLHGIDEVYEDLLDDSVVNIETYGLHKRRKVDAEEQLEMGMSELAVKDLKRSESVPGHTGFLRRTGTRVSLTCRHVPKVYKNLLRL